MSRRARRPRSSVACAHQGYRLDYLQGRDQLTRARSSRLFITNPPESGPVGQDHCLCWLLPAWTAALTRLSESCSAGVQVCSVYGSSSFRHKAVLSCSGPHWTGSNPCSSSMGLVDSCSESVRLGLATSCSCSGQV
jgi:hypothetical protein